MSAMNMLLPYAIFPIAPFVGFVAWSAATHRDGENGVSIGVLVLGAFIVRYTVHRYSAISIPLWVVVLAIPVICVAVLVDDILVGWSRDRELRRAEQSHREPQS